MRISIIIPIYNVGKYITKTLNSLKNQTDKRFEIIVVDDGSIDTSCEIAEKILSEFERTECRIIKQKNSGVSVARNIGLKNATGDYVMFLDGDDFVSEQLVEVINSKISDNAADIICWRFNRVNEDFETLIDFQDIYDVDKETMSGIEVFQKMIKNKFHIWTGSAVYNKALLIKNKLEYEPGCLSGEDLELTFKSISIANRIDFINKTLSFYLQREGSVENRYNIKRFDAIYAFKRMVKYIIENGTEEFSAFINKVGDEFVTIEFLGRVNHSLRFLKRQGIKKSKAIKILFSEIDSQYPALRADMISMMKQNSYSSFSKNIIIKLFLASPYLYSKVIDMRDKAK